MEVQSPYLDSPMNEEEIMYGNTDGEVERLADFEFRYPCKGCGEILEEGKAFVSMDCTR